MTQVSDVREIKEKVTSLDYDIKDVRRGLSMYKEQTDDSIDELKTTVKNNTTTIDSLRAVMVETNGVLKGIKATFQILIATIGFIATIAGIMKVVYGIF